MPTAMHAFSETALGIGARRPQLFKSFCFRVLRRFTCSFLSCCLLGHRNQCWRVSYPPPNRTLQTPPGSLTLETRGTYHGHSYPEGKSGALVSGKGLRRKTSDIGSAGPHRRTALSPPPKTVLPSAQARAASSPEPRVLKWLSPRHFALRRALGAGAVGGRSAAMLLCSCVCISYSWIRFTS
jgi:hypothetical protein